MSSPFEMSHEESSYHAVMKPSRHIKKLLLDVSFTASAQVPVDNQHWLPDLRVTLPSENLIPNVQTALVAAHLSREKPSLMRPAQFIDLRTNCLESVCYAVIENWKKKKKIVGPKLSGQ